MGRQTPFPPAAAAHWLLAGIALVIAPHVLHLPWWLSALAFILIAWRWAAAHRALALPGKWPLLLFAAASAAGILLQYRTLFGRDAGVALLTLMLALKLLEMRSYRDAMLATFLGYFLVMTNFFYTQSIFLAAYLMLAILLLTVSLILLNHPASATRWRPQLRASALLVAQAIPLMLLLFVLFPRLDEPLWSMPGDAFAGTSGLSETMAPGSISRLVRSDAVAFRSEFAGPLPPSAQLYWRALVMDNFDGHRWSRSYGSNALAPAVEVSGPPISYTLTIEPHDKRFVFALETPTPSTLPPNTLLTRDLRLLSTQPIQRRSRYALTSFPVHKIDRLIDPTALRFAVQLPAGGNPQARSLARRLRSEARNDADMVARVLRLFSEQPYGYTLTPPALGRDSVDEFLFATRSGFCEHYAGAFTFLMRAAGIPARVVAGYQGGEFNEIGNYLVVRQSDAHAWSEVWLKGQGWVRVDPTAAVAAERIESGVASALSAGEPLPFLVRTNIQWLKQLHLRWDALNNQWNQWVIGYDQEQQIGFFASLGFGILSWPELTWGMIFGIAVLLAVGTALTLWAERKPSADRVQAVYLRFCAKLERAGLPKQSTEGPADFARRLRLQRPELSSQTDAVLHLYIRLRYDASPSEAMFREFASRVNAFKA